MRRPGLATSAGREDHLREHWHTLAPYAYREYLHKGKGAVVLRLDLHGAVTDLEYATIGDDLAERHCVHDRICRYCPTDELVFAVVQDEELIGCRIHGRQPHAQTPLRIYCEAKDWIELLLLTYLAAGSSGD